MRHLILALTLAACGTPPTETETDTDTDTAPPGPCDDAVDVDACWDGCGAARATGAYDWGRLACLHGTPWDDVDGPAEQAGASADYQVGYDACYWLDFSEGWTAEGCQEVDSGMYGRE